MGKARPLASLQNGPRSSMDDVALDIVRPQPARQPEAITAGLIGDGDALDAVCKTAGPAATVTLYALSSLSIGAAIGWLIARGRGCVCKGSNLPLKPAAGTGPRRTSAINGH